jgi:hypothetical protein
MDHSWGDPNGSKVRGPLAMDQGPGLVGLSSHGRSGLAVGRIRLLGESLQRVQELLTLSHKQPVSSEACNSGHGAAKLVSQRTNDRDMGKVGADEFARHREDQAGLDQAARFQWRIGEEIGERQT